MQELKILPHNRPTLGKEEEKAAIRVIRSGWVAQGQEMKNFENEFCDYLGLPAGHAVALSSGTAALFLALWVLGAKGKKVAFPVYACSALRNAAGMAGGEEILIDISPASPNIDITVLKNSGADIAIIPHMFGLPVDFSDLSACPQPVSGEAEKSEGNDALKGFGLRTDRNINLEIIEDCAQSLGAKINGISTGLHGKIGIFSFYATKLITSGGHGGMLVSKDKAIVDAVRDYREFDQRRDNFRRFNFYMTDLQAAIGREQLKKLPEFLNKRSEIFRRYQEAGLPLLGGAEFNKSLTPVRYRAVILTRAQQKMITSLETAGIKAIVPIENWELLGQPALFPSALKLAQETVSVPIYPALSDEDIKKIIPAVMEILQA